MTQDERVLAAEELLEIAVGGASPRLGEDYVDTAVRVLASAFGCACALIAEPVPGTGNTHRLIALWSGERKSAPIDFEVEGTPFENALADDLCWIRTGLAERFSADGWLCSADADSWVSVRLNDGALLPTGYLALVGTAPLDLSPAEISTLRIFASRVASELECRRAEAETERLQDFGRSLLTSGPFGVGHFDLRAGTQWNNKQFETIVGRPLSECVAMGWESIVHPDDAVSLRNGLAQLATRGRALDVVIRVLRPDGVTKWIHLHASATASSDNKPTELTAFLLDLSAERATQESLSELAHELDLKNTELELILSSFLDLGFRVRSDGTYLDCWATDSTALMADREEMLGRNLADFLPPSVANRFVDAIATAISSRSVRSVEYALPRGSNTVHYEARFSFLTDDEALVVVRDISDIKTLENQLVHARTVQSLGRLVGGIAHDFNNVLHVVRGHATALRRKLDDPQASEASIDAIVRAVDRTSSLIDRLMLVSREAPNNPQPTPVDRFLQSMKPALRQLLSPNVALELDLTSRDAHVAIDEGQFERVILNLVGNAGEAMPEGGTLRISTGLDDPTSLVIVVSDTGEGMAPDVANRIFEPFFTTKAPGVGTGLGLATTYDAITTAGGSISVDTKPGAGSVFTIVLPITDDSSSTVPDMPDESGAAQDLTILVVEDQADVLELCADSLRSMGYRALEALNGTDALELVNEGHAFSALLTDVVMPGMSGPDLADELLHMFPDLPVVFMSGYAADLIPDDHERAAVVLRKPFSDAELQSALDLAIDGHPGVS